MRNDCISKDVVYGHKIYNETIRQNTYALSGLPIVLCNLHTLAIKILNEIKHLAVFVDNKRLYLLA